MKRTVLLLILILLFGQALGISSYATDDSFDIAQIKKYIPKEAMELLPDGMFNDRGVQAAEKFSFLYFLKLIGGILPKLWGVSVAELSTLFALVIISSVFHMLAGTNKLGGLDGVFSTVTSLCACVAVFEYLIKSFYDTQLYLQTLSSFANAVTPFITIAYTMGGNITAAAVSSTGLLICMTVLENINTYALYPMLTFSASLSVARACAPSLRIGTLANFIKGVLSLSIGLTVAGLSAVMAFQNILAASADTLSARAVRFAASSFIPIVGGAVSEAVRTVASSVSYIRTTVGGIGIAVIVVSTLPIFLSLMLSRINFALGAALADLLGCERECKVMKEAGGLVNFLIGLVSLMAVLFIYSLTLLVRCASAYGG